MFWKNSKPSIMLDAYELHRESGITLEKARKIGRLSKASYDADHGRSRRSLNSEPVGGLIDWCKKFLPHYFTLGPSLMHLWLVKALELLEKRRGVKLNVLGPRGGAKSTLATLAFVLRAALEKKEPYIWIISDTKHQACAHLDNLRAELRENQLLAESYPIAVKKAKMKDNTIALPGGAAIQAFGTGQRIRGRRWRHQRPSLIVCDDLQNDGHIRSIDQREKSRDWFHGMLMKAGTPATNVVNLATALHRDALAVQLGETPGWKSKTFKSIVRWPENMSLWAEWEAIYVDPKNANYALDARAFYEARRAAMDFGAVVLWPELESLYSLMCMRAESGRTAFEREKQNSPIDPQRCEWPDEYFDESIWFDQWPAVVVKTMALDPSKGTGSRRGDYSAFVMLGADRQGVVYLEADLARRPTPQIVADGVELLGRFRPDAFCIESNQFQDLLAGDFEREIRRLSPLSARPIPMENAVNKLVRIRRLGPYLSTKRLRFKNDSPGTKLLVDQLREFPIADFDDGPDAAEMALRLAIQVLQAHGIRDGLGSRLNVGT
jgi:predicted phage terminase large subunit-like protein